MLPGSEAPGRRQELARPGTPTLPAAGAPLRPQSRMAEAAWRHLDEVSGLPWALPLTPQSPAAWVRGRRGQPESGGLWKGDLQSGRPVNEQVQRRLSREDPGTLGSFVCLHSPV